MKTEFVSVASHQLRTPLGAIKLFTEMLVKKGEKTFDKKQKDYLDNIYQSTQRMVKLVNDLLNVSRIETGRLKIEPESIQMEDFIQSVIDEVEPLAKESKCHITFIKPKPKLQKIGIDYTLMRQVIYNFITNSIRYSSKKQCDIIVTLEQKGDSYITSVKDNGIGIPKKIQSRIFEKFFRADNARKVETEGSGLGMYVAKMIVEASGGKVWFESQENKGSTFHASLPSKGMKKKDGEKGLIGN